MKLQYFGTAAAEGISSVFCNCSIFILAYDGMKIEF